MTKDQKQNLGNFQWHYVDRIAKASSEMDLIVTQISESPTNIKEQSDLLVRWVKLENEIKSCNESIVAIGRIKERIRQLEENKED